MRMEDLGMTLGDFIRKELASAKTIDPCPRSDRPVSDDWLAQHHARRAEQVRLADEARQARIRQEMEEEAEQRRRQRERQEQQRHRVQASEFVLRGSNAGGGMAFQRPALYKFDFTKINSIEEIGKVLEILCTQLNFRITEELVEDMGIKEITERV